MSKVRAPLSKRVRYWFDNTIAKGTISLVAWLAVATTILIVTAGVVLAAFRVQIAPGEHPSFVEAVWLSLLRTLDPGTMGGDQGWGFRIIALLVTLGGLFIVATLIGFLTAGISEKLDDLRKGRNEVLEEGHTLILGWSQKIHPILEELVKANENQRRSSIVIMASADKVEMEDEVRSRLPRSRTRIICRTGDPSVAADLEIVHPLDAKSIVVLSPPHESGDAQVMKTVLAIMKEDPRFERARVVAELSDLRNAEALRSATAGRVRTVVSNDLIARITAQVCRQSGLSVVYQDLLDFDGDEVYFHVEPRLEGVTFGEALLRFEDSSVIGLRRAAGGVMLNPAMDTVIESGAAVVAISRDDDTIVLTDRTYPDADVSRGAAPSLPPPARERILLIGWNHVGPLILRQLEDYVAADSVAHVVYDPEYAGRRDPTQTELLHKLRVTVEQADTMTEEPLRRALTAGPVDHVIILCYRDGLPIADAEARTLMTLLQVRKILTEIAPESEVSIVTELLDVRDVELARVADPDDFIVSERLTSLLLAQLAENPELDQVFDELFNAEGSELNLRPATSYVPAGEGGTYARAVSAASSRGEVAIGYRLHRSGEIVVNPPKSEQVRFEEGDELILLA